MGVSGRGRPGSRARRKHGPRSGLIDRGAATRPAAPCRNQGYPQIPRLSPGHSLNGCCRTTGTRLVAAGPGFTDRADRGGDSAEGGAAVVGEPQRSVRAGCVACGITDAGAGVGRHLLPQFGDPPDGIVPGVVILLRCYSSWQYLS